MARGQPGLMRGIVMNRAPSVGSITQPVDQQSALPLYHGCPHKQIIERTLTLQGSYINALTGTTGITLTVHYNWMDN